MTTSQTTIEDAVEAGIEAASEMVSNLPSGQRSWDQREYKIAETAARAAVEDYVMAKHDKQKVSR